MRNKVSSSIYKSYILVDDPSPPSKSIPDTQLLCKRLEEKIISLTRMGDNLQKENKGNNHEKSGH
jgi:hypothetical protein